MLSVGRSRSKQQERWTQVYEEVVDELEEVNFTWEDTETKWSQGSNLKHLFLSKIEDRPLISVERRSRRYAPYSGIDIVAGSLFHLLANLMRAESKDTTADFAKLMSLIGRFFQICDDYQNLMSREYTNQKGFCEDLDKGKFSLPLIFTMDSAPTNNQLWKILQMGRQKGGLSHEIKLLLLEHVKEATGLEKTAVVLRQIKAQIEDKIQYLEQTTGVKNPKTRRLMASLKV